MLSFLDDEKEFEAQTFRIDSTHEYFKTCEYELLTPSELGDRSNFNFEKLGENQPQSGVQCHNGKNTWILLSLRYPSGNNIRTLVFSDLEDKDAEGGMVSEAEVDRLEEQFKDLSTSLSSIKKSVIAPVIIVSVFYR